MFEFHYIDVMQRRLIVFFSTFIGKYKAWLWKIVLGPGVKIYGPIHFRRLPKSKITIGANCTFNSSPNSNLIGVNRPCMLSTLTQSAKLFVGNNCGFSGTVIGTFSEIFIGNNVKFGANTLITDSNWHPEDPRSGKPKPIEIKDNVWLGVNVVVLKGVTIGENTVIGANSIVIKDIPANVVASGNPCQVLKRLD